MGRRRGGIRGEDGIGELEKSVGSPVDTVVERVAEGVESVRGFHNVPIMHFSDTFRIRQLSAWLKRKLKASGRTNQPSGTKKG